MIKQITLSALPDELLQAKTHKKDFLEQIERIIPWNEWMEIIKPYYYKGEFGNKPYELELMLRLHLLQNLYNLSDMATMEQCIDSRPAYLPAGFAGVVCAVFVIIGKFGVNFIFFW